jgi:hypothetical protein
MCSRFAIACLTLVAALLASLPARAGDDWSFIAGKYALDPADCKLAGTAAPFSKELVEGLSQEVLTREGITSPREVHCKFRSSAKTDKGWTVKADCEELGAASPYDLAVAANADGSVAVLSEDVYGPEALIFLPCQK